MWAQEPGQPLAFLGEAGMEKTLQRCRRGCGPPGGVDGACPELRTVAQSEELVLLVRAPQVACTHTLYSSTRSRGAQGLTLLPKSPTTL